MLIIDGSNGEGGGQILRTSLALSIITGQSICLKNIRAGRSNPGLQRQHLAAVNAAVSVCDAEVHGNQIGSRELSFTPQRIKPGDYHFAVGSAGSCMLVLQTVLPPLMLANERSSVTLEGGTHNPFAPPFDYLEQCFAPLLKQIGPTVELSLERGGFYPAGGGLCRASIIPASKPLRSIEIVERGKLLEQRATAIVAKLPESIGEREIHTAGRMLGWPQSTRSVRVMESPGQGNALLLLVKFEKASELVTGFGKLNSPAEFVAKKAVREMKEYLATTAPIGCHLADQLLLPMALGPGGVFRCAGVTQHTQTNIETIKSFIEKEIKTEPQTDGSVLITIPSD